MFIKSQRRQIFREGGGIYQISSYISLLPSTYIYFCFLVIVAWEVLGRRRPATVALPSPWPWPLPIKRNFFITPIYCGQVQQATVWSNSVRLAHLNLCVCTQTIGDATAGATAARRRFSFASQKSIHDSVRPPHWQHCGTAICRLPVLHAGINNINTDNMAASSHVPVPPPNQTNVSMPYFPNPYLPIYF